MAGVSLKSQLEKATKELNLAESNLKVREADTKDTRYGPFDPNSTSGKQALARLKSAGATYNKAKKYYDGILASYNKELQDKKTTGEQDGVSEEVQAAKLDLTVEQLRANKQAALDAEKAARDNQNQGALDQQQQATYSQLINTLAADEAQLKSIQEDLKKNFPSLYKGGTNGLKDWTATQATLEAIAERRGALPKTLQGPSLREFILKPTIDITTGGTGTGGPEVDIIVSSPTQAISTIQSVFKSVLNRDATAEELTNFTKVLNKAERSAGRKTKKSGGRTEYTTDLDRVQFLTDEIKKIKDPATGKSEFEVKKGEKDSLTSQDLMTVARANGIDLGQDQLNSYLTSIRSGKDINVVKNDIRAAAGLGRPDNIKKLLAEGTDLETIYAPYKRTMATILEVDPASIDINDSTLQTAIGDKELPIYEFRKVLKKDPRWQYTNNAREEVSNLAVKVLRDFGFQG
jgi:hypothetical protein